MASVVIQGDTSGSVTLQAPAVAGSTTVNLPSTIGNAGTSAVVTTDASGNVGIGGVTPSAWGQGSSVELLSAGYGLWNGGGSPEASIYVLAGTYFNSGFKYTYTAARASYYYQYQGSHVWATAPSGTAGNAVTFTQAMTLFTSGALWVGSSSEITGGQGYLGLNGASGSGAGPSLGFAQNGTFLGGIGQQSRIGGSGTNQDIFIQAQAASNNVGLNAVNGYLYFQTGSTERARITAAGEFWVAGTTDQGAYNIQCNGTGVWGAGAYVNGSDARIKKEIQPIDSGLDVVQKLNPVTYKYKEDWTKDRSTQTGFIAQELLVALEGKNYVDGVVTQGGSEGYYSVAYQNIIPILTKAIQELNAKVEAQAAEIAALKAAGSN